MNKKEVEACSCCGDPMPCPCCLLEYKASLEQEKKDSKGHKTKKRGDK